MRNWILANNYLPSEAGDYLVTYKDIDSGELLVGIDTFEFTYDGKKGYFCGEIIAWMKLPEPCIKGSITDEEIDCWGVFSENEKEEIKNQYSLYPQYFFDNPYCALHG